MNTSISGYGISNIKNIRIKKRRTPLCDRVLPSYTKKEEALNTVSHIIGAILGVITLILCILISAFKGDVTGIICGSVFGISMTALYTMSSIYHGLRRGTAKKVFQIIDHCTIYFLIAGTYTPMLVCAMAKVHPIASYTTLAAVWGLSALSITLTAIDIEKYKVFSMISYIGMGWAIIFSITHIYSAIGPTGFSLLLSGGILYTVGTLFFKFGGKKKYFHFIFHLFVLAGSLTHSICVILYAL